MSQINNANTFLQLKDFLINHSVFIKIEGVNIAHSIKLKTAKYLIQQLEAEQKINPKHHVIVESSSGNLGVALSLICKEKGYRFICVTDSNISAQKELLMKLYGAHVIKIENRDECGGYLINRINYIKQLLQNNKNYVWTNQYANQANVKAHEETTAAEITQTFKEPDYLFIGAGTCGTLMGCINHFNKKKLKTKIIAVDACGSVTFSNNPGKRLLPGIGTSLRPEICKIEKVSKVIHVSEEDTIACCYDLLNKFGMLAGASTGSVLSAIKAFEDELTPNSTIVAISPDLGDGYLQSLYSAEWLKKNFQNFSLKE